MELIFPRPETPAYTWTEYEMEKQLELIRAVMEAFVVPIWKY